MAVKGKQVLRTLDSHYFMRKVQLSNLRISMFLPFAFNYKLFTVPVFASINWTIKFKYVIII